MKKNTEKCDMCKKIIKEDISLYRIKRKFLYKDYLLKEEPCVDWRVSYQLGKLKPKIGDILPKQATYGYALTCHAAQGSEFDKVLVIEESFPFDKTEHQRWLYTAATRAAEKLVLVR